MHSTFWLENPFVLIKDIKFIPKKIMSKEEQMNCITRLVIFLFLLLYLANYKHSFLFFILHEVNAATSAASSQCSKW